MDIVSWNVNGIRAASSKGLLDFWARTSPDILCLQETKAQPDQLTQELVEPQGYHAYFASAEKKGYSGVALYSKRAPLSVSELGIDAFDAEGRTLVAHYPDFVLISGYFPNSQAAGKRLDYKLAYCEAIQRYALDLVAKGSDVVICGDFNVAHRPIDLEHPKANEKNAGYLPEEREWMQRFLDAGFVDTFRSRHPEPRQYTWWSYRAQARQRNVGWRIDYHAVNSGFDQRVVAAEILPEEFGSDHCPIRLRLAD